MPHRPFTAYFNLQDRLTSTEMIFDGLIKDSIPAATVCCLHKINKIPGKWKLLYFQICVTGIFLYCGLLLSLINVLL